MDNQREKERDQDEPDSGIHWIINKKSQAGIKMTIKPLSIWIQIKEYFGMDDYNWNISYLSYKYFKILSDKKHQRIYTYLKNSKNEEIDT